MPCVSPRHQMALGTSLGLPSSTRRRGLYNLRGNIKSFQASFPEGCQISVSFKRSYLQNGRAAVLEIDMNKAKVFI